MNKHQTIENKTIELLDALQQGAVKVGDAMVQYSPDVVDAALQIVRIDGAASIFEGFVLGVLAYIGYKFCRRMYKALEDAKPTDDEVPLMLGVALSGPTTIVLAILSVSKVTQIWNWVAIFEPKLALAKRIVEAAL